MPHSHDHTHHSDIWTKLSASWGFLNDYASTTYLLASLFDLLKGLDGTSLGVSWRGFSFGASIALFPTLGSTYASYLLNKNYETRLLENKAEIKSTLSYKEYAALATAYIGYSLRSAGVAKSVIDLIAKDKVSIKWMAIIYSVTGLAAFLGAYANIRTYKINMKGKSQEAVSLLSTNSQPYQPNKPSDLWTKLSAGWEIFMSYEPTLYFFASLVDFMGGLKGTDLNLSWYGLIVGSVLGVFPTVSSAYAHFILNKRHQNQKSFGEGKEVLTCHEKIALLGDWFGHTLQSAGIANALIALFSKNELPVGWKIAIYSSTTVCAFFGSYANVRTCGNNMFGDAPTEKPIGLTRAPC